MAPEISGAIPDYRSNAKPALTVPSGAIPGDWTVVPCHGAAPRPDLRPHPARRATIIPFFFRSRPAARPVPHTGPESTLAPFRAGHGIGPWHHDARAIAVAVI